MWTDVEKLIVLFIMWVFGIACGYLWAMKAYGVGLFGG